MRGAYGEAAAAQQRVFRPPGPSADGRLRLPVGGLPYLLVHDVPVVPLPGWIAEHLQA
ncbi:hypothetical protein ACFV2Q_23150 [Streptomyces sp. NPDC059650]|uniref:hypothetical protein n=1 Tax=Streptomyces sp. NPDC059650 TaxID=3346896 RepID=UPI0036C75421